jgi:hypothetical protein
MRKGKERLVMKERSYEISQEFRTLVLFGIQLGELIWSMSNLS